MENADLLQLFDREQRIEIEFPQARKELLAEIVRIVRPAPGRNFVLYSKLDETTADAAIEAQVAYFTALGQLFEWKVYTHDTPADLLERLRVRGFEVEGPDAVMILDLQAVPESLLGPLPMGVKRLERREELGEVKAVLAQVWGGNFDWVDQRVGSHMEIPGYLSVYTAGVDGQTGCVGWVYFHPHSQFASLWAGSTLPELRRRGLYTAVLAARVQEAKRRGYRYLVIDAGPESKPIVARHGFYLLTEAYDCEWKPPLPE
jgi:hypothetical protein